MKTAKLPVALLAASALTLSACGAPQNFGVGRNPLGSNIPQTQGGSTTGNAVRSFSGNPERLRALFLHPLDTGKLVPGQQAALEVIAIDDQGNLIDPAKLQLKFTSSKTGVITVNNKGVLTGLVPFESSIIRVEDVKTRTSTQAEFTVTTDKFNGNPRSLATLQLVMRDQITPGQGADAQFEIIARDALGNAIDPSKLTLDWSVADPSLFKVDKNGKVTALSTSGKSQITVRDPISGRVVTGTVQNLFSKDSIPPAQNSNNAATDIPNPIPSGNPGTPVNPTSPSQGNSNPLQPPSTNTGRPSSPISITLTPAVTYLPVGNRAQLNVSILDNQGNPINPNTLNLQWVSQNSSIPVDQTGTVTGNSPSEFSRVTVSIPGTNLSASAFVNTVPAQSSGGGGGGGGGATPTSPSVPSTYSTPVSVDTFKVHVPEPSTTPTAISMYIVTIGNAPGEPQFTIPYTPGTASLDVPPSALLDPDTTYPYSVVAVGTNGTRSSVVNSFGTTLRVDLAPTNLIGGSKNFNGIIPTPANTAVLLNRMQGNALSAGDNTPDTPTPETLTVRFEPTAANFGTVSLTGAAVGSANVSGGGTQGNPLVITGSKADVTETLNLFRYTPENGFVGNATVTMTTEDTVEGVATLDDTDILIFSVNSAVAAPPQNLMNNSPTFVNLITAVDTAITLSPLNNSELNVKDDNGDSLVSVLTPTNGSIALQGSPAGVTVSGAGTAASPLRLSGSPFYINQALNGGLTFTPTAGFTGTGRIQVTTTATDGSDTDTLDINIVQPTNLYNGLTTFPSTTQRMEQGTTTILDGAGSKALTVLYPPSSVVRVSLTLLDGNGGNAGAASNGDLSLVGTTPIGVTVTDPGTDGAGSIQIEGPVADVNSLLTAGVLYSPQGSNTGNYRLRMNSVDINNNALTDTNDIVNLEVSAVPQNRFSNNPNGFPSSANQLELGFDTPLTFAGFSNTALSVVDNDSPSIITTLTPSTAGRLTRANNAAIPAGLTISNGTTTLNPGDTGPITGTNAAPLVLTGSPTAINNFLNSGVVFTPNTGYSGLATVTINTTDGGGTDNDVTHIKVLPIPENLRNGNAIFTTVAIKAAPGVEVDLGGVIENQVSVQNYPANNTSIEVVLSVPTGKGKLRINGIDTNTETDTLNSVNVTGNSTNELTLIGSQINLNTVLQQLRYTPNDAPVAAPETVNITMNSNGGTLGDTGDLVPLLITNPPRNIYNAQDADETTENASFPDTGNRLNIFASQPLVLNNTSTATQPAVRLDVVDDSANVSVTLTPANTVGNTAAVFALTAAQPSGVMVSGSGTNASPLVISGPTADVKTTLALLSYTPQNGFTGTSSFTIVSDDYGPSPDLNTVQLNIQPRPLNNYNGTGTFPSTNVLLQQGVTTPFQDSGTNPTIHALSVQDLASYGPTDTATVRLQVPSGTLTVIPASGVTITAGANNSSDLTLSATGANIPNINTILNGLTFTPAALPDGQAPAPIVLTMTHGPISDVDTLNLLSTRPPLNRYNGSSTFPATRRVASEGTPLTFTAADTVSVGSAPNELVEDSPSIRVTLTPSLISGTSIGTVDTPTPTGGTKTGGGTNASPLVLTGPPAAVNTALAGMTFAVNGGVQGNGQITMTSTDFVASDSNDLILLDIRSLPANRVTLDGTISNTFPGTGSPRNVGLNTTYLLDGFNSGTNSLDRPLLSLDFYQANDDVTVTLSLAPGTGFLSVSGLTAGVTTGGTPTAFTLSGKQADINLALAKIVYNSANTAGNVDLTMSSTNGAEGDNSGDTIRFNVQNSAPLNFYGGGNFPGTALRVVNEDDSIPFGAADPGVAGNPGNIPALSITDDNTSVTTTLSIPAGQGTFALIGGNGGATVTGSATNNIQLVGSPTQINTALAGGLRFTPTTGLTAGNYTITMNTTDGVNPAAVNTIPVQVQQYTATTATGTSSSNAISFSNTAPSILQIGRNQMTITASNVTVGGLQVDANTQVEFYKVNGADVQLLGTAPITSFNNTNNTGTATLILPIIPSTLGVNPTTDGTFTVRTQIATGGGNLPSGTGTVNTTNNVMMVYPNRTIYGVETAATSILHLINTSGSAQGNGTLTTVANPLLPSGDKTSSLAKHPSNGQVYYIEDNVSSTLARLRVWDPTRGNVSAAYTTRGTLGLSVGAPSNLTYNFKNAPRLEFNNVGTLSLYASGPYTSNDITPSAPLSGLYRINNFLTTPTAEMLTLQVDGVPFDTLANDGDLVFEPSTGHMFLTSGPRLYVSKAPVSSTATTVDMRLMSGFNPGVYSGDLGSPAAMTSLSFDGAGGLLITGRYGTGSRMYRLSYSSAGGATDKTYTAINATQLPSGNYTSPDKPMVDTSSAHEN